jgi:hypothetical protein
VWIDKQRGWGKKVYIKKKGFLFINPITEINANKNGNFYYLKKININLEQLRRFEEKERNDLNEL